MKKIVLTGLLLSILIAVTQIAKAQCTVTHFILQNERQTTQNPGSCTITFDMTFNIMNNAGNKFIYIHQWISSQYPDYFHCVNGQPGQHGANHAPVMADLVNAFMTIGIDNSSAVPTILSSYPPDPTVPMTPVVSIIKVVLPDGSANFTLQGITVTLPITCGTPVIITVDYWSSQSAASQIAHCVNCGLLYSQNYMTVAGIVNCSNMVYQGTLTNRTGIALNGFYNIYADINGDNYFTPETDTLLSGPINYSIIAGPGTTTAISGTVPLANRNQSVFVVFTQTTGSATGASHVFTFHSTQCSPLPVQFSAFTAKRISARNVLLKWETVTEINNTGFTIQRNNGNNEWQSLSFIPTIAPGGNSSSVLDYSYNDLNPGTGVMQYRIMQTDIDGKNKYTEIRSVWALGQDGRIGIYPNPSSNGRVNIVFDDKAGVRDASLTDISGHIIRSWKVTNGNTIIIENLNPGIYIIRILTEKTMEIVSKKIIISK